MHFFDYETTLVSMFTIMCSTVCRRHDRSAYSNISDPCVFCSYDPQYAVRGLQLTLNVVFRCVCLIGLACVTLGPKAVILISRGDTIATAGGGVHFLRRG